VVDNYDSFTYNLVQIIRECGWCKFDVLHHDKIDVDKASRYDGILFSPGPGLPADFPVMAELLRKYYHKKHFLGICLGHQAIAEFFKLKLTKLDKVYHGVKTKVKITDPSDYLFRGMPVEFEAGLYHSWAVIPDPEYELSQMNINITAISSDGVIMAISHDTYDIKGIQFHPESYISTYGRKIIYNWIEHFASHL